MLKESPLPIDILYGCCQVETSVRDLAATRRFMIERLGAGLAEQRLAREIAQIIPDPAYDVDHIECGEAIFQINQPSPTMLYNGQPSIHQAYLDRVGPCVTNLNFFIDDHAHAHRLLESLGAPTHIRGPSSAARSLADYGETNSRTGADERPFLFMGSRKLIGLDLEIMEPNFLRFSEQDVQYPAYARPRPKTGDGNLKLDRLIVVVEGLEATLDNLEQLFTPGSVTRPHSFREGPQAKSIRVTLGGIEIEYCQPLSTSGYLGGALARFGPGVVAAEFCARDIATVVGRTTADGAASFDERFEPFGVRERRQRHRLGCRAHIGFDIVLTPHTERRLNR